MGAGWKRVGWKLEAQGNPYRQIRTYKSVWVYKYHLLYARSTGCSAQVATSGVAACTEKGRCLGHSNLDRLHNGTIGGLPETWIAVVFTISDLEFHRIPQRLFELVNAIVVSSELLREEASKFHKHVFFIDDPIEVPIDCTRKPDNHGVDPELVWMGHPDNWAETKFIKGILDRPEFASLKCEPSPGILAQLINGNRTRVGEIFPNQMWRLFRASLTGGEPLSQATGLRPS